MVEENSGDETVDEVKSIVSETNRERRDVLRLLGAGTLGATLAGAGAGSATAQANVNLRHSLGALSSTSADSDNQFDRARSLKLNLTDESRDPIAFGGDTGRSLRVRNTDTGREVTLEPVEGTERVDATRLRPEGDREPDPRGIVSEELTAIGLENREETALDIDVTVSGDADPFPDGVFGSFVAELLDESGNIISATDERIVGTAYQYNTELDGETVRVTRDPGVDEDWTVVFAVAEDAVFPVLRPDDMIPVANNSDDEVFEVDLTELNVEPGEYEWDVGIGTPDIDFENPNRSNIIMILSNGFNEAIEIGDGTAEAGPFTVGDFEPADATVTPGAEVTLTATVTNEGDTASDTTVWATLDGNDLDSQEVTNLGADDTAEISFDIVAPEETGEFAHGIRTDDSEITGTLTVEPELTEPAVTRQFSTDETLAGETTAVTVTIERPETTTIESFTESTLEDTGPDAFAVESFDGEGSVSDGAAISIDFDETDSTVAIEYAFTAPAEIAAGTELRFNGTIQADGEEFTVGGDDTLTVRAEPTITEYTTEDGTVDVSGVGSAIDDWRSGVADFGLLREVIDAWRSGESVE